MHPSLAASSDLNIDVDVKGTLTASPTSDPQTGSSDLHTNDIIRSEPETLSDYSTNAGDSKVSENGKVAPTSSEVCDNHVLNISQSLTRSPEPRVDEDVNASQVSCLTSDSPNLNSSDQDNHTIRIPQVENSLQSLEDPNCLTPKSVALTSLEKFDDQLELSSSSSLDVSDFNFYEIVGAPMETKKKGSPSSATAHDLNENGNLSDSIHLALNGNSSATPSSPALHLDDMPSTSAGSFGLNTNNNHIGTPPYSSPSITHSLDLSPCSGSTMSSGDSAYFSSTSEPLHSYNSSPTYTMATHAYLPPSPKYARISPSPAPSSPSSTNYSPKSPLSYHSTSTYSPASVDYATPSPRYSPSTTFSPFNYLQNSSNEASNSPNAESNSPNEATNSPIEASNSPNEAPNSPNEASNSPIEELNLPDEVSSSQNEPLVNNPLE